MTPTQVELLHALGVLCATDPEVRVGQLVVNLATLARGPRVESVWDAEDDELLAAAHRLCACAPAAAAAG